MIEIVGASFGYDATGDVLHDISLRVAPGESVGLVGPNGAGKSTLLRMIVGLELGWRGAISVGGVEVSRRSLPEVRARVGYLFQDSESQLFMPTVEEDVAFGPKNQRLAPEEVERRTAAALDAVGIAHLRDRRTFRLSGGEKRLAAIAAILSMQPEALLMDEPTAELDPRNRRLLIDVIGSIEGAKLIASHDLDMVWETCARTVIIAEGRIAADGPTEELLADEELLRANSLELPLFMQGDPRRR